MACMKDRFGLWVIGVVELPYCGKNDRVETGGILILFKIRKAA